MIAIRDNFVFKYKNKAEEWEGCSDDRGVFVDCYKLILTGLDELLEKKVQSIVVIIGFERHMDELVETMDYILSKMEGK